MSNKIVPSVYRTVIDDVIVSIKPDFDEFGVSEEVLAELQSKWEAKVIQSRVAEFESPPQPAVPQPPPPQYPTHPHPHSQLHYPHYANPYIPPPPPPPHAHVKSEPQTDQRYLLQNYMPQRPGQPYAAQPQPVARPYVPQPVAVSKSTPVASGVKIPQVDGPSHVRIPQLDGSSSSGSSESPPPSQYAPHSSHPSLPQPVAASNGEHDDEAINSDLDDSDSDASEDVEDGGADTDIMFCTYDKVARVKNKWKCVLKDGMVHIDGRDYLFSKCNGEFEW